MALLLRRPWAVIAAVAVVVTGVWAAGSRRQDHHVRVAFDNALNLAPGLDVQAAGVDVGKVSKVEYRDGRAIVTLGIDDGDVWPLREGTVAQLRLGSTAGSGNRRVELTPGPADAPALPEGGVLGTGRSPVEFDELLQTFGPRTRDDIAALARRGAAALPGHERALGAALAQAAPAVDAVGGVMGDLRASGTALSRLLRDGNRVTRVLAGRRDAIAGLIVVAGRTFDTFAANAAATQATLAALPGTFRQARGTFARLEPSLDRLQRLLGDLAPAARRLPGFARATTPTLRALRRVAQGGDELVSTAVAAAPPTTRLLRAARPLVQQLEPALARSQKLVRCIAPYAPDVAGLASNWSSWNQEYDDTGHYLRVRAIENASALTDSPSVDTATFSRLSGLHYNGIPAPGAFVGKPAFDAGCGVGRDAVDPANDWKYAP